MTETIYQVGSPSPQPGSDWQGRLSLFWENAAPYAFISPFFIAFAVFQLFPILFSVFLSVQHWNPYRQGAEAFEFVELQNFIDLAADSRFWHSLHVTLTITIICTLVGTMFAVILAVLIDKMPDRFSAILRAAFFMPAVTSVVVIAYIWKQLLSTNYGTINVILEGLGLERQNFLGDSNLAIWSIIVMLIWSGLGWDTLIITSALRNIPRELYESAKLDGANELAEFRYITIPLLRPVLLFVVTTGLIFLLGIFAQVQLLTNGAPLHRTETVALYLYNQGFEYQEFGYASAIAVVLTLIMFVASYVNYRFFGDVEY